MLPGISQGSADQGVSHPLALTDWRHFGMLKIENAVGEERVQ